MGVKAGYVNQAGVAGVAVMSLDLDDFTGETSSNTYPLLRKIEDTFDKGYTVDPEIMVGCGNAKMCMDF